MLTKLSNDDNYFAQIQSYTSCFVRKLKSVHHTDLTRVWSYHT